LEGGWIATFADPDGNYFQLMSPWEVRLDKLSRDRQSKFLKQKL